MSIINIQATSKDAETVGGKHASDFAPSGFGLGTSCINLPNSTDLNNLPEKYKLTTGFFMVASPVNKPEGIGGGWVYLLQLTHYTSHILQLCFELNSIKEAGNIFIRQYIAGSYNNWTAWKKPDASTVGGKDLEYLLNYANLTNAPKNFPANGGNADTVGGKTTADLQNYNNLTNKPALKTVATTGSYNDLINKPTMPTTLPANGGNADTVDGKHASDFAPSGFGLGGSCAQIPTGADLNNLPEKYKNATGFFMGADLQNRPEGLNGWVYLIQEIHNEKYKLQIALMLNGGTSEWGNIFIRQYVENVWKDWKKPDASTVGGKGVEVLYSNCSATAPTVYLGDNVQYQVY